MSINDKPVFLAACLALLLVSAPEPAHAYIDPGTAGLLVQWIIGGVVGALFVTRLYWHKLKSVLVSSPPADVPAADAEQPCATDD